jgi:hypothetical protein
MTSNRQKNVMDELVSGFDRGLRTIMGTHQSPDPTLQKTAKRGS